MSCGSIQTAWQRYGSPRCEPQYSSTLLNYQVSPTLVHRPPLPESADPKRGAKTKKHLSSDRPGGGAVRSQSAVFRGREASGPCEITCVRSRVESRNPCATPREIRILYRKARSIPSSGIQICTIAYQSSPSEFSDRGPRPRPPLALHSMFGCANAQRAARQRSTQSDAHSAPGLWGLGLHAHLAPLVTLQ